LQKNKTITKNFDAMNTNLSLAMNLPLYVINKMMEIAGRNPQYQECSEIELFWAAEKELALD